MNRHEVSGPNAALEMLAVSSCRRIVIAGWPGSGKTTMAEVVAGGAGGSLFTVVHTDDFIGQMPWSEISEHVAAALTSYPPPFIVEGTASIRAVRKWFAIQPGKALPIDALVYLSSPKKQLNTRQAGMGKGCDTIFRGILPALGLEDLTLIVEGA